MKIQKIILIFIITLTLSLSEAQACPYGNIISHPGEPVMMEVSPEFYYSEADSSHDFDVLHYYLLLFPYDIPDTLSGVCRVTFKVNTGNFSTLKLNSENLSILSVMDDYGNLEYTYESNELWINLRETQQPGDTSIVYIEYYAEDVNDLFTLGFHRTETDYCFTIAEPFGARKWYPCYDYPHDKAKTTVEIWVPEGYKAASNGNGEFLGNTSGYSVYIWEEEDPIATYLISIATGPYIELNDTASDTIPLTYYVYPEDSVIADYDFANTADMVEFFTETFGYYPFQTYGMAEGNLFNGWGAMEHQPMTTYGHNLITGDRQWENVVAHELAHMWWGDCLTPLTFADIWLNEGFAVYSECLYIEARYDTLAEYLAIVADRYFNEFEYGLNYPIYNPPSEYLFGHAIYDKGAYVQHMLRTIIGDDAFFSGLHNYAESYKFGNVITSEYIAEMEAASGEDLGWFFDEWIYDVGFPIYEYDWFSYPSGGEHTVVLNLRQIQTLAPIFQMPVEVKISSNVLSETFTVWNDQESQNFQFTMVFQPTGLQIDPDNKILKYNANLGSDIGLELLPVEFSLEQNFPNPFNASTIIPFNIPAPGSVQLKVFNIDGQHVSTLADGFYNIGHYRIKWSPGNIASGMYYIALQHDGLIQNRKLLIIK